MTISNESLTRHRALQIQLAEVGGWNRANRLVNRSPNGEPHPEGKMARKARRLDGKCAILLRCGELANKYNEGTSRLLPEPSRADRRWQAKITNTAFIPNGVPPRLVETKR